jgi:hypothetical protein
MADQEHVPKEAYFSWGTGVSSYYSGPLSQKVGNPKHIEWGLYYAKDLTSYPGMVTKRLNRTELKELETGFVRLHGIPHLDSTEALGEVVADLPPGTPVLCIVADTAAITLRASTNPSAKHLEPQTLQPSTVALMNLIVLHGLRTMGRATSGGRLTTLTRYSSEKLARNLHFLHRRFGAAGAGILRRSKNNPDIYQTYLRVAEDALVLDARPNTIKRISDPNVTDPV